MNINLLKSGLVCFLLVQETGCETVVNQVQVHQMRKSGNTATIGGSTVEMTVSLNKVSDGSKAFNIQGSVLLRESGGGRAPGFSVLRLSLRPAGKAGYFIQHFGRDKNGFWRKLTISQDKTNFGAVLRKEGDAGERLNFTWSHVGRAWLENQKAYEVLDVWVTLVDSEKKTYDLVQEGVTVTN